MKKFSALLLSLILLIFGNFGTAFAGGINKEETLADGTKLIYVSTDRIREVCLEYWKKSEEIKSQRYSVTKDWVIKGASLAVAACGYYLSAKAGATQKDNDGSCLALVGQIASCVVGFIGFMYPDYHEHKLIKQHGSEFSLAGNIDNKKRYIYQWGPESTFQGVSHILDVLYGNFIYDKSTLSKEEIDSGACIVIRPESLYYKDHSNISTCCFNSGVYTQLDMNEPKNPTEDHPHGYRWALEHSCIPIGR